MTFVRLSIGAIALGLAMSAAATPSTYGFNSSTGGSSTWAANSSGANSTSGTNYGNFLSYAAGSGPADNVSITAWGGTGGASGTLQSAFLNNAYSTGGKTELAITSRSPTSAGGNSNGASGANGLATGSNNELVGWAPNTGDTEHAIDNRGAYESLLLSFTKAVTLNSVSVGFPSTGSTTPDSDATVLAYTGSGDPTAGFATRSYADLLATGNWVIAGNLLDLAATGSKTLSTSIASKYWMIGAYMAIGSNSTANLFDGLDYIKVNGFSATLAVPEPSTLALFGVALAALAVRRRRSARAV